jgi:hypothetical protein
MARDSDQLAGAFERDRAGGVLSGLFAEENDFDRRSLWRIGSWGVGAVAAVVVAVMANQTSLGWRREQVAAADLAHQAQQIQSLARESQVETRRLASAIDTLNGDRDRLYSRVTVIEQGLDSVTGAISRQSSAGPPAPMPAAAAKTSAPATAPGSPPATAPSATAPSPIAPSTAASSTPVADPQAAPKAQAAVPAVAPVATMAAMLPPEKPRPPEPTKPEPAATMGPPPPPQAQAAPLVPAPSTATPLVAAKSMMAPPDPAVSKLIEPAKVANLAAPAAAPSASPDAAASDAAREATKQANKQATKQAAKEEDASKSAAVEPAAPEAAVQRTDFAVDLGGANSVGGLRALWRGLLKSNAELSDLRPIIMIKESNTGLGMQLRLAAGPLKDAAAAAKICAAMTESERPCETTVFDGQRLAMKADEAQGSSQGSPQGGVPAIKPMPAGKGGYYRRGTSHHSKQDDAPASPKQESSTFSSLFGISKR